MTKYFLKPKAYCASSHFKILDKEDKAILGEAGTSCYSRLTYTTLPPQAHKINVFIPKDETAYKESSVLRWAEDLNELGFRFQYTGFKDNMYNFILNVDDFKGKVILCIVLQLIRYLSERGLAEIPDRYFNLVDDGEDKFVALQKAHLMPSNYANSNHACRSLYDKTIITKEKFWENLKKDKTSARNSVVNNGGLETNSYWQ